MIARRRSSKQPKGEPPVTDAYRASVLFEELRGQNQIVIESVAAVGERLDRHATETAEAFVAMGARLDHHAEAIVAVGARLDRHVAETTRRFDAMDRRFDGTDSALAALREDGRELAALVSRKADAAALGALDQRVTRLERRAKL
jgi:hypothetical protein